MSRSLKKAPYVEKKLFDRIVAMNEKNEKKVLKTWSRSSTKGGFFKLLLTLYSLLIYRFCA